MRNLPIGVFDSGVGGLTVLAELQQQLPNESYIYLGDMARLPYGTKSPETIERYSLQICDYLIQRGIKMLVVACNTASALALPTLQAQRPHLPIIGVLHPGARAACATTRTGHIAVIATEATVNSQSYTHAIHLIQPEINVVSASCSLFVALAEEGWTNSHISAAIAREYLNPLLKDPIDTLVLGCTHFPVLSDTIKANISPQIKLVNSAIATAEEVSQSLEHHQLNTQNKISTVEFLVTDSPNRFIKTSQFFLPYTIESHHVTLIDF